MISLALLMGIGVPQVEVRRVPNGGIQPQVVQENGTTHMLYYSGKPVGGDLFYIKSKDDGASWSEPVRVNQRPETAVAMGTIRGGQLAVSDGTVHIVWNGAGSHGSSPLYYTHSRAKGGFEVERDLMGRTKLLDGGATVAAGSKGQVYVAWHASDGSSQKEQDRKVWIAKSSDGGTTFAREKPIWNEPTGACACCGMKAVAKGNEVFVAYRSAKEGVDRDAYLLRSVDGGASFNGEALSRWRIGTCPMSSFWIELTSAGAVLGAEEAQKVVITSPRFEISSQALPAKYPTAATNAQGSTLWVWAEGTGWDKGGSLAWQTLNKDQPVVKGQREGLPKWSFPAVMTTKEGRFLIYY